MALAASPTACAGAARTAVCTHPRYLLSAQPRTIVSNERHRLSIHATREACGRPHPVRSALVRLGRYRSKTNARGRATLTVRLANGSYVVRLYVNRRVVAHTRVRAIPNVAS